MNLNPSNHFYSVTAFKIATLKIIQESWGPRPHATSIDLHSAYYHVLLHQWHAKFTKFTWRGTTHANRPDSPVLIHRGNPWQLTIFTPLSCRWVSPCTLAVQCSKKESFRPETGKIIFSYQCGANFICTGVLWSEFCIVVSTVNLWCETKLNNIFFYF